MQKSLTHYRANALGFCLFLYLSHQEWLRMTSLRCWRKLMVVSAPVQVMQNALAMVLPGPQECAHMAMAKKESPDRSFLFCVLNEFRIIYKWKQWSRCRMPSSWSYPTSGHWMVDSGVVSLQNMWVGLGPIGDLWVFGRLGRGLWAGGQDHLGFCEPSLSPHHRDLHGAAQLDVTEFSLE